MKGLVIWHIVTTFMIGLLVYGSVNLDFPKEVFFTILGMWFVESCHRIKDLK